MGTEERGEAKPCVGFDEREPNGEGGKQELGLWLQRGPSSSCMPTHTREGAGQRRARPRHAAGQRAGHGLAGRVEEQRVQHGIRGTRALMWGRAGTG